ncbi:MAG TPA: aryl-sulfate sulfotransferase N-terminal domain-containing protein, partial [Steroidobacteraceae bacterium]
MSNDASQAQDSFPRNEAQNSGLQINGIDPGVSPFIARVSIYGIHLGVLSTVAYTVQPKAGSVSKAVNVSYSNSALAARGYLTPEGNMLTLPVIGLYAGYTNQVALQFSFQDGSALTLPVSITTAAYNDPTGIYQHPTILTKRAAGSALGFDFFY